VSPWLDPEEQIIASKAIVLTMRKDLDCLFRAKSVALVGASANPSKLSHIALQNLSGGQFKLYPVNPKDDSILGFKCYPSVLEIPGDVDLALVSLPAEATIEPVRQCVKKGVGVVIVTASGFKESGSEGAKLETELVRTINGSRTRLLGPNTMGILVPSIGLDTLFIPRERSERPKSGSVALLSQSGAVSVSSMEKARFSGLGISTCVGLGNKADISENDILEYLANDKGTSCVALYLESFADGRRFVDIVRKVSPKKPVVLLKSGRTPSGKHAASSHTGAISMSSESLVDGALAQSGAARVYDEEELIDVAKALAIGGRTRGDRICVVASAGGYGVIAADLVESTDHGAGLSMARLSSETTASLRKVVPGFSSVANPVDLTAAVTDQMYDSVLGILQNDPGVDGIMMSLELQPPNVTDGLVDIAQRRSTAGKTPIVISTFAGERTDSIVRAYGERGVLAYPTLWRAVRALGALARRGKYLSRQK
jgi:acetate---CoA ligase (ADP-forming) subunit alpha